MGQGVTGEEGDCCEAGAAGSIRRATAGARVESQGRAGRAQWGSGWLWSPRGICRSPKAGWMVSANEGLASNSEIERRVDGRFLLDGGAPCGAYHKVVVVVLPLTYPTPSLVG